MPVTSVACIGRRFLSRAKLLNGIVAAATIATMVLGCFYVRYVPLIIAHLLGGTDGLNLQKTMTDEEIRDLVSTAFRVTKEISKQIQEAGLEQ